MRERLLESHMDTFLLHLLGSALASGGRCDEARVALEQALTIRRQQLDPESPDLAASEQELASCTVPG